LTNIGTDIRLDKHTASLSLQRQADRLLIEAFAATRYNNKALDTLNRCHLRLRAVTLADITAGDGRTLLPGIVDGFNPMRNGSPHTYPKQGQLPPPAWRLWKAALKRTFQINNHGRLATPLGD
jgi:hypothetical protein